MEHRNIINNNNRDENNSNNRSMEEESTYLGVPVHSQVMKIKQEFEKIKHPSLEQPAEMRVRRVLREITRQRSPSPLGLAA